MSQLQIVSFTEAPVVLYLTVNPLYFKFIMPFIFLLC